MGATFSMATSGHAVHLRQPESIEYMKQKSLKRFYFWSTTSIVDAGKDREQFMLSGTEVTSDQSTTFPLPFPIEFDLVINARTNMNDLMTFTDNGDEVTISGLDYSTLNDDFLIVDFQFQEAGGLPHIYTWRMSLEKV